MKVCGFTIVKNAVKFDYPLVEAIQSALPIVDKFLVALGDGEDTTEELVRSIDSDKIEIVHTVWPKKLSGGGYYLGDETNKAFDMIGPEYDWCLYLQSDEVIHEEDYAEIRKAMEDHKDNLEVEGFIFKWKHFWGNFDYVGFARQWYRRDVRIIRNDKSIRAWHGAQGFRKTNGEKPVCVALNAHIYHYGWVRHPFFMQKKVQHCNWNKEFWTEEKQKQLEFDYNRDYDYVLEYQGTHPQLMEKRMKEHNWEVKIDTSKINLPIKDRLLMWFEKKTGHRLFENQHFHVYGKRKRNSNFWDE